MKQSLHLSRLFVIAFFLLPFHILQACGFDFVGSCATAVKFTVNNAPSGYFVTTCAYGNSLPSTLGTNLTTLQLSTATTVSWESCTNMMKETAIYYRVFNNPLSKGTFQKGTLSQQSIVNNPPYRTRTFSANLSIDLLVGLLPNTNYTIEIYYQLSVDSDGNGSVDDSKVANNNGAFYATSFQTGNINVNSGFPVTISTQSVTCSGGSNGTATLSPAGGTAPYTFLWSNGATTAIQTGLRAGNYSVTITDATNAKSIKSFSIAEPAPITITTSLTQPSCGASNGAIAATISGGTSPYTIVWSNAASSLTVSNLAANSYSATATDSKGCSNNTTVTLVENCGSNGVYCASASQNPWNEWIARVQMNTLNNESEKSRADRFVIGYSDWTDKGTTLTQGLSYPLSITPGLSWSGQQTNLYFRAWIDFNKNSVFEDSEKIFERNATSQLVTSNIVIPAVTQLGTTTMRVSMKRDAYPTACESFLAGEVEDYSIILVSGNSNPCVTDAIPPVLNNCPQNINLTTSSTCAIATWIAPTATDNCTTTPSVSSTRNSGFCFPIGSTTVVYTATDARNNSATCSFSVVVSATNNCTTDVIPPVLSNCPQNINLTTSTACATATWTAPTATDNCTTTPSVNSTQSSGFCFPIGSTTVVYTATDARNNTATCSFNVIVGSTSIGTPDLGIAISSPNTYYRNWTNISYKIVVKNNSSTAFSNAKIEFKFPIGTVNGGTVVVSNGLWEEWCIGAVQCFNWTIGSLAKDSSATLTVPLFVLNPNTPLVATAKLLSSTPIDGNPSNNEASLTLNFSSEPTFSLVKRPVIQQIPVVVQQILPNPTEGELFLDIESLNSQHIEFQFSDAFGKIVKREQRFLEKGLNQILFDVSQLPQGLYFITPSTNLGRQQPSKFIKI
ncbi:MAG: HYR domain-containing protein [Saprospiraceae bacterium]|nr:HYR domain-containing protein [Saprospiraceae bacterium]